MEGDEEQNSRHIYRYVEDFSQDRTPRFGRIFRKGLVGDGILTMQNEAAIISHYLLKIEPSGKELQLYTTALKDLNIASGDKLLRQAMCYPVLLPYLDSGLAILKPEHPLRQRIYVMLAILETSPHHINAFIHKQQKWWPLKITWAGVKTIVKSSIGIIIVRLMTRAYDKRT